MKRTLIGGAALLLLAIANARAEAPLTTGAPEAADISDQAPAPATYDVFIDGVTGYAFVKTPAGWKFVRNLKADLDQQWSSAPDGRLLVAEDRR